MSFERGSEQGTTEPVFTAAGNMRSVPGILESLGVAGRSFRRQKAAVQAAWDLPAVRILLEPHEMALRMAGLLD